MIIESKYEYGDKTLPYTVQHRDKQKFNDSCMIFEPVRSVNDSIFDRWENICKSKGYPYAVYLVKVKDKISNGKPFTIEHMFTMITNQTSITEINNPPDSEGIMEKEELEET